MFVALLGILWLAVRSARVVIAILGHHADRPGPDGCRRLLATARFNLISVAFIPLFVGPRRRLQHSVQRPCAGRAARPAEPRGSTGRDGHRHRPGAGAVGRGDRRGLLRLPADQLCRRGRTRHHCRPRHDRRLRLERRACCRRCWSCCARPRAGWPRSAITMLAPVDAFVLRHRRGVLAVGARCGDRLDARCCRWCASTSIR